MLARQADKAGARLHERTTVTGPVLDDDRPGRRRHRQGHRDQGRADLPRAARRRRRRRQRPARPGARPAQARRPADGRRRPPLLHQPAARRRLARVLARAVGRHARARAGCCPATAGSSAWATAPSTSASGVLNTSAAFGKVDYRDLLPRWLANMPGRVGLPRGERDRPDPRRRAADGLQPHARTTPTGVLLVGDSGGMVNPFNGEGIAYAMESGELAARAAIQALARSGAAAGAGAARPTRARSRRSTAATTPSAACS